MQLKQLKVFLYRTFAFICDILLIFFLMFFIIYIYELIEASTQEIDIVSKWSFESFVYYFGFLAIINKDITGNSFFKKIFGLKIISTQGNKNFIFLKQLLIRNLTFIVFPIEIIIFILKNKRLGDILSKTSVVLKKNNKFNVKVKTNKKDLLFCIIINLGILFLLILINSIEL